MSVPVSHRCFMNFHDFFSIYFRLDVFIDLSSKINPKWPLKQMLGGSLLVPFSWPFPKLLKSMPAIPARSIFLCILVALWLPLGSLWAPFGYLLAPFASLLAPFGSRLAPSGSLLECFGSLLDLFLLFSNCFRYIFSMDHFFSFFWIPLNWENVFARHQ